MTDEPTHIATAAAALDDPYAALSQHLHGDGDVPPLRITYRNWRGEVSERNIVPQSVWFGATDWHPEPQWLLSALDIDKGAARDFALADFGANDDAWRTRALTAEAEVERLRGASAAVRDVLAERNRQIAQEGWTEEHDDEHTQAEIAQAAACYALAGTSADEAHYIHGRWKDARDLFWPRSWTRDWWKPTDRRRNLVKAGALILAEIERLDRASLMDAVHPDTCATPGCINPAVIRLDDRRLCRGCYATHDFGDDA